MDFLAAITEGAATGAGIGIAGLVIGGGLGIGKLASSAMEGISRQPEAGGAIQTAMIIAAALIEGLAFGALILGVGAITAV